MSVVTMMTVCLHWCCINKISTADMNNCKCTDSNKNRTDKIIETLKTGHKNKMKNNYQKCYFVDMAAEFAAGIW